MKDTAQIVRCFVATVIVLLCGSCRRDSGMAMPRNASPAPGERIGEPQGTTVAVNGHHLWYRKAGHGPALLLIPGGPGSPHDYLYPAFARLEDAAQVIYFDAFGRGQSDRARDPVEYSLEHDIDDVEGLRAALGLDTMILYGHSYGGLVAQGYALKYPRSLSKLVLADTLHSAEMWQKGNNDHSNQQIQDQFPEVWSELKQLRESGRTSCDPSYQEIEGRVPTGLFYFYNPSIAVSFGNNLDVYCQIAGPDADGQLGGDLATVDFRPRLHLIQVPTLILTGRFDRVALPRYAVQFRELIPQAEFVMFERSGHAPFVEEPERHDAVMRAFLAK
jgi:proline iminopeptidase